MGGLTIKMAPDLVQGASYTKILQPVYSFVKSICSVFLKFLALRYAISCIFLIFLN